MSSANIKTTMVMDIHQMQAQMRKLEAHVDRLIAKNKKLTGESKRGAAAERARGTASARTSSSMLAGVGRQILAYASLYQGVRLVTDAMRDQDQMARKAQERVVGTAGGQRNLFLNMGSATKAEQDAFTSEIRRAADKLKISGGYDALYEETGAALSGTGAIGGGDAVRRRVALDAAIGAARLAPHDPAIRKVLAAGAIGMGKATGSNDALENLGLLKAFGELVPAFDWGKIGEHGSAGIISMQSRGGGTAGEAAARLAAIAQGSGDLQLRRSVNAGIQMDAALARFLPEETTYKWITGPNGQLVRVQDVQGTGLATSAQRIAFTQSHPAEREQILQTMTGIPVKQQVAVRALLGGDISADMLDETGGKASVTGQAYKNALAAMDRSLQDMASGLQKQVAQWDETIEQQIARLKRTEAADAESFVTTRTSQLQAVRASFSGQALEAEMEAAGLDWRGRTSVQMEYRSQRWIQGRTPEQSYTTAINKYVRDHQAVIQRGGDTAGEFVGRTETGELLLEHLQGKLADTAATRRNIEEAAKARDDDRKETNRLLKQLIDQGAANNAKPATADAQTQLRVGSEDN